MINLLPPEAKENVAYARRNTQLIRWSVALILVIFATIIALTAGQLYISSATASYERQVEQTEEQLKLQKLDDTQKRVKDMSNNLKLVVQVLSKQVFFSSLLQQIGAAIPPGAVLTGLSINQIQGGIDLTAAATDYETATQVQVNLQDPNNRIFQQADIENIQCATDTSSEVTVQYPCTITLRALFSENNDFTFTTDDSGGSQ
jgi:Tfp pilus assembly protein PilN